MAITNHDRVGKAMELLRQGLGPFIAREFQNSYKETSIPELMAAAGRTNRTKFGDGVSKPTR